MEQTAVEQWSEHVFETRLVRLMMTEPFWASVLRGVERVKTTKIPTAMVGFDRTSRRITFSWNPEYIATLTAEEVFGIIKHEAMHIAFGHLTNRFLKPAMVFNWAADFSINSQLPSDQLSKDWLLPGRALPEIEPGKMSEEQAAKYQKLSTLVESLPLNESAEWYFTKLMENNDGETIEELWGGGGMPTVSDEHADYEDLSDEEKEMAREMARQIVGKAVKEADKSGAWGSISQEMRATIRLACANVVDWRSVLQNFCGNLRRGTRQTSWQKINKRLPGLASGAKKGFTSSIAVYIDQSGSVDDDALALAFSSLSHLTKRTEFTTFHFDTEVDEASEMEWKRGAKVDPARTRCGGTDFDAPTKHANKNKHRFDGYIIITDGQADKPVASRLKRCYLLVPNTQVAFAVDGNDSVVTMTKGK